MKTIIQRLFDNVQYWHDKSMLLKAINLEYYQDKNIILQLLNISSAFVDQNNKAKLDLWNHMIISKKLGDDILNHTSNEILSDISFARKAIYKYNRTYIFLSKELQENYEISNHAASNEIISDKYCTPIMMFMPEDIQNDIDISLMACSRNIHNIQYAPKLQKNKYFIVDIMNFLENNEDKRDVLSYIDQSLLEDKIFVSKLGCFDNLCDRFQGDILYVSNAVKYDIKILDKTKLFHDSILKSAIHCDYYNKNTDEALAIIFNYIKRFNDNFKELNNKIEDKTIIQKLMWNMGEVLSDEFT
jgi:hypothetical protein